MGQDLFEEDKYLQLFISGSEDAFDTIFKRYYEGLLGFAKVLIPYPSDEAEDIVAEMFCTLWLNRKQLHINNTLKAYLYTAVKNRVMDYYRKRRTIFSTPEEDIPASSQQPDHLLMYKDVDTHIQALINQLPPQMKLVFRMNRYEGFSYEEIAGLLNISVNSVKTHMFRALKSLKAGFQLADSF
jgi:RNA polymerase sigma-70 factor (family 1)